MKRTSLPAINFVPPLSSIPPILSHDFKSLLLFAVLTLLLLEKISFVENLWQQTYLLKTDKKKSQNSPQRKNTTWVIITHHVIHFMFSIFTISCVFLLIFYFFKFNKSITETRNKTIENHQTNSNKKSTSKREFIIFLLQVFAT